MFGFADLIEKQFSRVSGDPRLRIAEGDGREAGRVILALRASGFTALTVRGRKMKTREALFDEVGAALQFPWYFGENWNALDECISDLDWLRLGAGRVVVVVDAEQVLADAGDQDELRVMVDCFASAAEEFGKPIAQGACSIGRRSRSTSCSWPSLRLPSRRTPGGSTQGRGWSGSNFRCRPADPAP